jgi:hypothetical protein
MLIWKWDKLNKESRTNTLDNKESGNFMYEKVKEKLINEMQRKAKINTIHSCSSSSGHEVG